MKIKIIEKDTPKKKFTRIDFVYMLINDHGLAKDQAIKFSREPEVEFNYWLMDQMGDYIEVNHPDIKEIITKGVALGYLTE